MILRPSKIFVSFHQLRHYFQTKVSELVATSHQQPSSTVTQLANFSTTQQSIIFFSDIQRSLIQKAYCIQQPFTKNPTHEKLLLKVIQHHFPIVKVFSQPTLHGRNMIWTNTHPTQQLRTMMSSSGGTGGGNTLMTWGLPRTAMVGVGRNNGFGATRQFSTTKSPSCVNFFQNTTPQQPNIFAHLSSRIFSPAGTKMNHPCNTEERPKFAPFFSLERDVSSGEESVCSGDYHGNRVSQKKTSKGMGDLVGNIQYSETMENMRARSEFPDICRSHTRCARKDMDHIIRHDEISTLHSEEVYVYQKNKRKLSYTNAVSRRGKIKHLPPHDQGRHVKKKSMMKDSNKKPAINVYMLITLDSTPFLSTWSTQRLNSSFVDTIETLAKNYQLRIQHILNLLERLRFSGRKFRVVARQSELRIYFPTSCLVQSEEDAIEFLKSLQVDNEEDCFNIIAEKDEEYFSYDHHGEHNVVGPDYFKDLQMFLDRTDYLIQTSGSTFRNSH